MNHGDPNDLTTTIPAMQERRRGNFRTVVQLKHTILLAARHVQAVELRPLDWSDEHQARLHGLLAVFGTNPPPFVDLLDCCTGHNVLVPSSEIIGFTCRVEVY